MLTGFIYVITNEVNGKQYVGKTTDTIEERYKGHLHDRSRPYIEKRPLYDAMNKYGIEHFSIKQLEECSLDILEEREQYWINKLNTFHQGYNATLGGDGKSLYDYSLFIEDYKDGMMITEIAKKYGCSVDVVRKALQKEQIDTTQNAMKNILRHSIKQFSKKGEYIQTFSSCYDAGRWLYENQKTTCNDPRKSIGHITDVARGKRQTAFGYKWEFANEEDKNIFYSINKKYLCLETNQIFSSAADAGKWCGLKSYRSISCCCNGIAKSAGKHPITGEKLHWKYIED